MKAITEEYAMILSCEKIFEASDILSIHFDENKTIESFFHYFCLCGVIQKHQEHQQSVQLLY